jgi:hypothetical protein
MLTDILALADPFLCALTNINIHLLDKSGRAVVPPPADSTCLTPIYSIDELY